MKIIFIKNLNYLMSTENNQIKYSPLTATPVEPKPKPKSRKKLFGSFCCIIFLLTFFLCFFLIPRNPTVSLNELILSSNNVIEAKFNFKNNNYYSIDWKNPDIELYWIPYNGQTVGQVCYGDNPCESGKYYDNMCAIKLGEFVSNEKFGSNAKSSTNKNLQLISTTNQEIACASWMILNPYQGKPQRLLTDGHIFSKSNLQNYKKIYVPKRYYYFYL